MHRYSHPSNPAHVQSTLHTAMRRADMRLERRATAISQLGTKHRTVSLLGIGVGTVSDTFVDSETGVTATEDILKDNGERRHGTVLFPGACKRGALFLHAAEDNVAC